MGLAWHEGAGDDCGRVTSDVEGFWSCLSWEAGMFDGSDGGFGFVCE